jgi:DNA recombination protein RmuC
MTTTLLIAIIFLNILIVVLFFVFRPKKNDDFLKLIFKVGELQTELQKLENGLKEDFRINREESGRLNKENREELGAKFLEFSNQLISQLDKNFTQVQERMKEVADRTKADNLQMREEVRKEIREFQDAFDKNVKSFNELQREKFGQLTEELRQKFNNLEEKLKERLRLVENQQNRKYRRIV